MSLPSEKTLGLPSNYSLSLTSQYPSSLLFVVINLLTGYDVYVRSRIALIQMVMT